jgi:hypothetical protein
MLSDLPSTGSEVASWSAMRVSGGLTKQPRGTAAAEAIATHRLSGRARSSSRRNILALRRKDDEKNSQSAGHVS